MNTFGDLLRKYIERSGKSIYSIAKLSGVNRCTLQKVLSGDRLPSPGLIMSILPYLILSEPEIRGLWDQFELLKYGETTRLCHQQIDKLIRKIYFLGKQVKTDISSVSFTAATLELLPEKHESDFVFFNTPFAIQMAFLDILREEITSSPTPHAYINIPAQQPLFANIFNYIHLMAEKKPLTVIHQTALSSQVTDCEYSFDNLNALSNILQCFSSRNILYQIFYYYSNNYEFQMSAMAFSYYIVVSEAVIFLNHDCSTALLCRNPTVINEFQEKFLQLLKSSRKLMTHICDSQEIMNAHMSPASTDMPVYVFEFQPCFALFLTMDILQRAISPTQPNKLALMQTVQDRIHQLKNLSSTTCIFSESGLKDFVETGLLIVFPACDVVPLSVQDRLTLLRSLYGSFQSERNIFQIATSMMPILPTNMIHRVHVNVGFDFCTYNPVTQTYQYLSSNEATTLYAFTSYAESLLVSPMVHSRQESMEIIKNYIKQLES